MTSSSRFGVADAIFIAALIFVGGLCAFIGIATPLGSFAGDAFFLLDNAYRVVQGQVPHADFSSPWGPVMFLIDAAGLRLSGMRPSALGYANALFGSAIAIWAFFVARSRWSPAVACAAGIYTLLLIAAPFFLGGHPRDYSYAMIYNRYGYALLGIILLECVDDMFPAHDRLRRGAGLAFSTGVALGLLAFLKVSYAFVGIALVVVLAIAGSAGRMRRAALICGGFAFVALLALSYLRFDVPDMLRDLAMAADSRVLALDPSGLRAILSLENVALLFVAALVARYRGIFVAVITIAVGSVVLITNQQLGGFPLDGYAALALVGAYARNAVKSVKWPAGVVFLTALCVVPLCVDSVVSLISAALERQWTTRPGVISLAMPERGTSLTFAPVIGKLKSETIGAEYVEDLNDGLNLLRNHIDRGGRVLTFDEFNPFNYILDLPSPRGGFASAAYDYIFDDKMHPTAERFFGNASYVMVPKYKKPGGERPEEDGDELALMRMYGGVLRAQFVVVAETKHWVLWRRKTTE